VAAARVTRSLGLRTDLMTIAWDGAIDELEDGVIRARTPTNPDFYFGNFLLYPDAPAAGDATTWVRRFEAEFADDPRIRHVTLRWDRPDGARGAIAELEGFALEETVVLATDAPHEPPRRHTGATLRRIESDADWDAVCALQIATTIEQWGEAAGASEAYARDATARNRGFVAAGRGAWFGAFLDGVLAADLGVFVDGGLGRYQSVETAAAHRRQGLCGTLVHHAAQVAIAELGAETLVLVGLDDHTAKIYASCGFDRRERLVSALRRPAA
jgi:hypothetical protein